MFTAGKIGFIIYVDIPIIFFTFSIHHHDHERNLGVGSNSH